MQREWFETWFDSKYYHLLYAHRDHSEADSFIRNIIRVLELQPGAKVLDLACGKGRHAQVLASLGYDVTGADLSEVSIREANKATGNNLRFVVHDMRRPLAINYFDAVLNLFTSFGYFESVRDNIRTIDAIYAETRNGGLLLIDYFNSHYVEEFIHQNPTGSCASGEISFKWEKRIAGKKVIKNIEVNDNGRTHLFTESVSLFKMKDFSEMMSDKFEIIQTFGDYNVSPFELKLSPRLILVCRKK